jgi:hypothetical protein
MLNVLDVFSFHRNKLMPLFADSAQADVAQGVKHLTDSARAARLASCAIAMLYPEWQTSGHARIGAIARAAE